MANHIQVADLPPTRFVLSTSRYSNSTVLYYGEGANTKTCFDIYKRGVYAISPDDRYTVVTSGQEYRPDLMSRSVYGTVDYWWKILEANGMKDIFDFKVGTNIRLPNNILE